MIVIGITGSIASGKSTVAKLIAKNKHPLFDADKAVLDLYKNKLKTLETIIHPFVRKKINSFLKINSKILILEIPLLIESKLNSYFDKVIFVDAKKKLRLKRYLKRINDKKTFEILNKRQLSPAIKKKACDIIINNNYSLVILKKNVKKFIEIYE